MSMKIVGVAAVLALAVVMVAGATASGQEPPAPSAGERLAGDLRQPRGITIGPDGMIYVAEAGTGGPTQFVGDDGNTYNNGRTGRISRIDPETGERTTVADNIPSNGTPMGEGLGAADVAFIGPQLYYVHAHGGAAYGFPDHPTGVYRVNNNGSLTLVADIGQFNIDNPVEAITSGVQPDVEPGGNPYSMTVRNNRFYVVDGNHNRLIEATVDGDVSEIVEFPGHPVSTGIALGPSGLFYVAYLGRAPFLAAEGKVVSVTAAGAITEIASGASMLTDVEVGPAGQLYALQFNDTVEAGEELFAPFTGKVLRVNANGTFTPIVTGLTFTTTMEFDGNTLYVLNDGINALGGGELWRIDDFASIQPPSPAPTAAPVASPTPAGITGPDTGSGSAASEGGTPYAYAVIAMGAAALAGGAVALRRRGA